MFGLNPVRSRTDNPLVLAVQEVFPTIQGEGPYGGMPSVFVRLAGCNLACHFCDTEFETNIDNMVNVEDLVDQIHRYPAHQQKLVVVTGGEPLRQNLGLFMKMVLYKAGSQVKQVQLETAGTLWDPRLDEYVEAGVLTIVCSPKTPKVNTRMSELCNHWKYIIRGDDASGEDGLPMQGTQPGNRHLEQQIWRRPGGWLPQDTVWVSPCDEHDEGGQATRLNTTIVSRIAMAHGYRVSLQTHKILGVA